MFACVAEVNVSWHEQCVCERNGSVTPTPKSQKVGKQ